MLDLKRCIQAGIVKEPPGFPGGLLLFGFSLFGFSVLKIRLNGILPMFAQRSAASNSCHRLTYHFVIEPGPRAVAMIIHRPVGADSKFARRFHCVDVGSRRGIPSRTFPVGAESSSDLRSRIAAAGILHAVGGDHKKCVLRHIPLRAYLWIFPMCAGPSHRWRPADGTAPDTVVLFGDGPDFSTATRSWSTVRRSSNRTVETNACPGSFSAFPAWN